MAKKHSKDEKKGLGSQAVRIGTSSTSGGIVQASGLGETPRFAHHCRVRRTRRCR